MSSRSREQLEEYLSKQDIKAVRVIDVGGAQLGIKGRTKSWEVDEYIIADLPHPHQLKIKPTEYVDLNDRREGQFDGRKADYVFCLEVTEYLFNPLQAVKNMASWLRKGGELIISFHWLYALHPPTGKDYLRYSKYGALKLIDEAGLMVVDYVPRELSNLGMEHYLNLIRAEGYRFDKEEQHLSEAGCIIRAIK